MKRFLGNLVFDGKARGIAIDYTKKVLGQTL
jgi:hypothetical protein